MKKQIKVNAHLHTPYSFSAFESIPQALDMALNEDVKVVGINDFYSTDGYAEWDAECRRRKLFPLFNIEFISLQQDDQRNGVKVNDPNNPGRTYLSGKGLAYPTVLSGKCAGQLEDVRRESNRQVKAMCAKLNELIGSHFSLDIDKIERELTKGNIRERHLAKALRIEAYLHFNEDEAAIRAFFEDIFGGRALKSPVEDFAGVENEIRGNLLKAGGAAFVAEEPKAFLPLDDVQQIILAAGGIPTYPFLADDAKGEFTDFERDLALAAKTLKERGIVSAEFITTRNSLQVLERYAGYLWDEGFVVTFGSEHNTPAMEPVELFARGGVALSARLLEIGYKGACIVAAHQELFKEGKGYVDSNGVADIARRKDYVDYGDKVIKTVI